MKQMIFDGHNDLLLRLSRVADPLGVLEHGDGHGHLDLPRMREGGFVGGLFAIFVPPEPGTPFDLSALQAEAYDLPFPPEVPLDYSRAHTLEKAALLLRCDAAGLLRLCRTTREIDAAIAAGEIAAVLHIEGAEGIDPEFHMLDVLHAAGLRSLGPVWSRPNLYGRGVPFRFPSDGDTGPGLPERGKALVAACAARGILVDTAHMSVKEFDDVAQITGKPVVASHSNAVAVTRSARNLTDDQLRIIGQTGGIVGLNYATAFLRPDGRMLPDTPLTDAIAHLTRMIEIAGEDCVGLGSDFDGAVLPAEMGDVTGLPKLVQAMRDAGFGPALIDKITHLNWRRVLRETWGG